MLVATADKMRKLDQRTIIQYGIPSKELMQNAAQAVLETIIHLPAYTSQSRVLILCGKGNNAGDGFALAYQLSELNKNVDIIAVFGTNDLSDDANYFYNLCKKRNLRFLDCLESINYYCIVDAVFGIGYKGSLPQQINKIFCEINKAACTKIAIDIPSGVNTDTGVADDNAFNADITVTFEVKKPCHLLFPGCNKCGNVVVKHIGIKVFDQDIKDLSIFEIDNDTIKNKLPKRDNLGHKGSFGTLSIIAGSKSYQGAACMCTMSALKSGVGIVNTIVPNCIYNSITSKINSAVIDSFKDDSLMFLSSEINNITDTIKKRKATAVLIGCGLAIGQGTAEIVNTLLSLDLPIILDADALTLVSENLKSIKMRKYATVLTPHIGEFARMSKLSIDEIKNNRISIAHEFAKEYNLTLVLKDSVTVVADANLGVAILSNPCSALAKGGSGDVLAGLISGFVAQHISVFDSAVLGVFIHNLSGRLAANENSEYCLIPDDIIQHIPEAFKQIIY